MLSVPKWVKKASSYVVTERDGDSNTSKSKQTQHWFSTIDEANTFYKNNS